MGNNDNKDEQGRDKKSHRQQGGDGLVKADDAGVPHLQNMANIQGSNKDRDDGGEREQRQ